MNAKTSPTVLRLSNSEAANFRRCRRKWYLKNYRGLEPRDRQFGTPSDLGTRVHNALEKMYSEGANPEETFRAGIEMDVEAWPVREADIRSDEVLGLRMLEGYREWLEESGADSELEIIGAEVSREVDFCEVSNGRTQVLVTLLAKLDLHARRFKEILAVDFKTVQNFAVTATLKIDTQMLTQHLVEFLHLHADLKGHPEIDPNGIRATGTIYRMIRKVKRTAAAKPPFFKEEVVRHNDAELRAHWNHMAGVAGDIARTREGLDTGLPVQQVAYPSPKRECSYDCEFFKVCVMADDGSDFEGVLADNYREHDPLQRYLQELGMGVENE